METVRIGVLGAARITPAAVIRPARATAEAEVVAIAARDRGRADTFAAKHGVPQVLGDYGALIASPDIDAVYNPLPNGLHARWTDAALEAGKHVLCEKPLARLPHDVERAFDAAERADRLLMEAFMWRQHPQSKRLRELVQAGAIGELRLVRCSFSVPVDGSDEARYDPGLDGGALMDVGCYCVSGSRFLAGEPVSVSAQQVLGPTGIDVRLAGTLVFPGGALGQLDCAYELPLRQEVEVVGSEGVLRVSSPWAIEEPGIELRRGGDVERIEVAQANRYRLQTDNFSRAVRGLEPPLLGREDALGQARTIDALYRSAERGGEPVPL
jgi:D-xylose 1-dehydrogenase (NADP+, D-xylono-1,5-lactone-forming)